MCVSSAIVHRQTERRVVCDLQTSIAALLLKLPDGSLLYEVNARLLETPGGPEYSVVWFRLTALTLGRAFAVLTMARAIEAARLHVGHQHAQSA